MRNWPWDSIIITLVLVCSLFYLNNSRAGDVTMTIEGSSNNVYILQATGTGNMATVHVTGNSNYVDTEQYGSNKTLYVEANGNNNIAEVIQKDAGAHVLDLQLVGDGHYANVLQYGAGSHLAIAELTNAGGSWNFTLVQSGASSQSSTTSVANGTCYTAGGCNLIVSQP
jgi:hypothetical protein